MASFTPEEFYDFGPESFKQAGATLEQTLSEAGCNVVLQAAILQPQNPDPEATAYSRLPGLLLNDPYHPDDAFTDMDWSVITALRGPGRSQGVVSTPTKNIPTETGLALAAQTGVLDATWEPRDLRAGLEEEIEAFYINTSETIAREVGDEWHTGTNYRDLLANEVGALLVGKFGQAIKPQMNRNRLAGIPSFMCRQLTWVGGFSADIMTEENDEESAEILSIEPNVMIGVLVVANSNLPLEWVNTDNLDDYEYAAFGRTPIKNFLAGMELMDTSGAKLLAPYALQHIPKRSFTSMCTEVTLEIVDIISNRKALRGAIAAHYYPHMGHRADT